MKIKSIIVFLLFFGFSFPVSAQEVQVVNVKGKVLVLQDPASSWEPVKEGSLYSRQSQIKTASNGKCLILFGDSKKNTMTVEKNSQIKIENVVPGDVFLTKGRVFTLIKESNQTEDFKVRTLTVITGARGTGWVTEFEQGVTSVFVFEDDVVVSGLGKDGEVLSQVDIHQDFQTSVSAEGAPADIEPVPDAERAQWKEEMKVMEQFREDHQGGPGDLKDMPPQVMAKMREMNAMDPQQRKEFFQRLEQQRGASRDQIQNQPRDGDHGFREYMGDLNGRPMEGFYGDGPRYEYASDYYFGGFDSSFSGEFSKYIVDEFGQIIDEQNTIINDQYRDCPCPSDCAIRPPAFCPPSGSH